MGIKPLTKMMFHIIVLNLAIEIGKAIEEDKRRRPFHYCILELEMKLADLPILGDFIGFLDDLRDRKLVKRWLKWK